MNLCDDNIKLNVKLTLLLNDIDEDLSNKKKSIEAKKAKEPPPPKLDLLLALGP